MKNKIFSLILAFILVSSVFSVSPRSAGADAGADELPHTYLNSDGRLGIYPFFYPGSEIANWQSLPGETKPRIHLRRERGSSSTRTPYFEFDFNTINPDINNYVYEINVYPKKFTGINGYKVSLFNVYSDFSNGINDTPLMLDNNKLTYNNTTIATISGDVWTKISCIVNLSDNTFDAYVNGVLKASGISLRERIVPKRVRVAINYGYTETDFYFDNIRLYEGNALCDNLPKFVSHRENESDAGAILSGASVFMNEIDNVYINGIKTTYQSKGYYKLFTDNTLYVSPDCAKAAIGCEASQLTAFEKEFDLYKYVPLKEAALALGKCVYEDSRGWVCISDSELGLSNSIISDETDEQSDIIDRYMHFDRPSGDEILSKLKTYNKGTHPRIFVTPDDVIQLKSDIQTDDFKKKGAVEVIRQAEEILRKDLTAYEKEDGLRLFIPCLTVRNNLVTLTTAYMISDDDTQKQKYFNRIWQELENVCLTWNDWNTERHFLDSGKLLPGIALAYDVCYNELGSEKRKIIRDSLLQKYMYYTCASYAGGTNNYNIGKSHINWGAVCNGGALLVCLATMDDPDAEEEYLQYAKFIAEEAIQGLEYPISSTFPDGAWSEGLSYYGYVVEYLSWSANALCNSCGSDFGIMSYPGVAELPRYAMYIQSLKHGFFGYSDGAGDSAGNYVPSELFLMARLLGNQELNDMLYDIKFVTLGESIYTSQFIRDFIFYSPGTANDVYKTYPTDSTFGNIEVSVMKSGWKKDDTYFASVGGRTDANSHFDKGSFIFEALGERWAIELGKDDYNIAGGYYGEPGWTLYRKRAEGHNTLVFNPTEAPGQTPQKTAYITKTASGEKEAFTIYDLSEVYSDNCTDAKRGFRLSDSRKTLLIQDEFTLKNASDEIYWFMHTRADIAIVDADTVTLTQNGKTVKVDFISNLSSFTVSSMDAKPLPSTPERPGQNPNDGIRKICFKGAGADNAYITAKITPADGETYSDISYTPISEWKTEEPNAEPPLTPINTHTIDFERYNEAVYLNKNGSQTYPDNYYNRQQASVDLLPITSICQNMFTNGTLSVEKSSTDDGHGKYLTMRRLSATLYQNNGFFYVPANYEMGAVVGKSHGELVFEFDHKYEHNWKSALYITPVSQNGKEGSFNTIIRENSQIGSTYIGPSVTDKWIHVKLIYNLDTKTVKGIFGDYHIEEMPFTLSPDASDIAYFKLDATMSGTGRYASFDNFTTSYIPKVMNYILVRAGKAKAKFEVDRPDVNGATCFVAVYSGNTLERVVQTELDLQKDENVYESREISLSGDYSKIKCFVFDSKMKPLIKSIEK